MVCISCRFSYTAGCMNKAGFLGEYFPWSKCILCICWTIFFWDSIWWTKFNGCIFLLLGVSVPQHAQQRTRCWVLTDVLLELELQISLAKEITVETDIHTIAYSYSKPIGKHPCHELFSRLLFRVQPVHGCMQIDSTQCTRHWRPHCHRTCEHRILKSSAHWQLLVFRLASSRSQPSQTGHNGSRI